MRFQPPLCLLLAATWPLSAIGAQESPYQQEQHREIKSLSEARIDGLREGKGLGYAMAAELNGYPGPLHVLELSEQRALDEAQRNATQALYQRMRDEAAEVGRQLVQAEADLDSLFRSRVISETSLADSLARIATLEARVRGIHLQAHLKQTTLLTQEQMEKYQRLRGYGDQRGRGHDEHHLHGNG